MFPTTHALFEALRTQENVSLPQPTAVQESVRTVATGVDPGALFNSAPYRIFERQCHPELLRRGTS